MTKPWTDLTREEKGDRIRPLIVEQLLSYTEIAAIVGVSRTAIAGAADRNKIISPLAKDASGERGSRGGTVFALRNPRPRKVKPERPKMSRIAPTQPAGFPDDLVDKTPIKPGAWAPLPGSTPTSYTDATGCQWPIGAEAPFHACNLERQDSRPYCSQHNALAYRPVDRTATKRKGT